jgi:hypothetical protein
MTKIIDRIVKAIVDVQQDLARSPLRNAWRPAR